MPVNTDNLIPTPTLSEPPNGPAQMLAMAASLALKGAPPVHSTGVATAIGASPALPAGLVPYVGLHLINHNTADPAAVVEWVCVDTSPVTWIELSRTGPLVPWTPAVTQGVSVAATVSFARYQRAGAHVDIEALLSITGTGTAGSTIRVTGIPFTASLVASNPIGWAFVVDQSAGDTMSAFMYMTSGPGVEFFSTRSNGSLGSGGGFAGALTNLDSIRLRGRYEIA